MMTRQHSKSWSDLELEQYLLGEMDDATRRIFTVSLQQDSGLKIRLEKIKQSDADILSQYSPEYMSGQILAKQSKNEISKFRLSLVLKPLAVKPGPAFTRLSYALPLLLVAGFAFMFSFQQDSDLMGLQGDGLQIAEIPVERKKGGEATLRIIRKTDKGQELISKGDSAVEGDLIQIQYIAAGNIYGLIFSVDGAGAVTPHLLDGKRAVKLEQGAAISLNHAYELDDAPSFERFFLVTKETSFHWEDLKIESQIDAIQHSPDYQIMLDPGFHVTDFNLHKD